MQLGGCTLQDGLVSLRMEVKDKPSSKTTGMLSLSKSLG